MSLFDDIMSRVNEFNNKADELHTRLRKIESWKPKISEQMTTEMTSLRDDLDQLDNCVRKDIRKIRQDTPSWLELNAIVKSDAPESATIIVDRVKDKAGGEGKYPLSIFT